MAPPWFSPYMKIYTSILLSFVITSASSLARAENIVDVLKRSEQAALGQLERVTEPSEAKTRLEQQFANILKSLKLEKDPTLVVVKPAGRLAALVGEFIVVSEAFGNFPEAEIAFLLSHEIGHVVSKDFDKMGALYLQFIPGEVVQEQTDAVAPALGRAASQLKYEMEYAADEYGLRQAQKMGFANGDILGFFNNHPEFSFLRDSPTHPGTLKRRMALLSKI